MSHIYYHIKGYRNGMETLCKSDGYPLIELGDVRSVIGSNNPNNQIYSFFLKGDFKVFSYFKTLDSRDGAYLRIAILVHQSKKVSPIGGINSELDALQTMMRDFEDRYLDEDCKIVGNRIDSEVFENTIQRTKLASDLTHNKLTSLENGSFGLIQYDNEEQLTQIFREPFFREMAQYREIFFMTPDLINTPSANISLVRIEDPSCLQPTYSLKIVFLAEGGRNLADTEVSALRFKAIGHHVQNVTGGFLIPGLKKGDELRFNIDSDKWELSSPSILTLRPDILGRDTQDRPRLENQASSEVDNSGINLLRHELKLRPKTYQKRFKIIDEDERPIPGVKITLKDDRGEKSISSSTTNSDGYSSAFNLPYRNEFYEFSIKSIKREGYEYESDRLEFRDIKLDEPRVIKLSPKKHKVVFSVAGSLTTLEERRFQIKNDSGKVIGSTFRLNNRGKCEMYLPRGHYSLTKYKRKKSLKEFYVSGNRQVKFNIPKPRRGPIKRIGSFLRNRKVVYSVLFVWLLLVVGFGIKHPHFEDYRNSIVGLFNSEMNDQEGDSVGEDSCIPSERTDTTKETYSSTDSYQERLNYIIAFANSADFNLSAIRDRIEELQEIPEESREKLKFESLLHGDGPLKDADYQKLKTRLHNMLNIAEVINDVDPEEFPRNKDKVCLLRDYYDNYELSKAQNGAIYRKFLIGEDSIVDNWDEVCK